MLQPIRPRALSMSQFCNWESFFAGDDESFDITNVDVLDTDSGVEWVKLRGDI